MTEIIDSSLTDPARIGYPPQLPLEIAMGEIPVREIFEAYSLTKADFIRLGRDEGFLAQVEAYKEQLRQPGQSFALKARLQAEELLKESWKLIHSPADQVPPTVKADLIKSTMKWAGLDASANRAAQGGDGAGPALSINIQFSGKRPDPQLIDVTPGV